MKGDKYGEIEKRTEIYILVKVVYNKTFPQLHTIKEQIISDSKV